MTKKISPPDIYENIEESTSAFDILTFEENEIENLFFHNETIKETGKRCDSIIHCIFSHCLFGKNKLRRVNFTDISFRNCDLSNTDFGECNFYRVEFINCKLLGCDLGGSVFNHVLIESSNGIYSNFTNGKIRNTLIQNSDFRNGAFNNCKIESFSFENCNLSESEFSHTPLKGMDLRNSRIENLHCNIPDLRGAVVSSYQAVELAKQIGIIIKD